MKITNKHKGKVESTIEWLVNTKVLIVKTFTSEGEVEDEKIIEGCASYDEAKQYLKQ